MSVRSGFQAAAFSFYADFTDPHTCCDLAHTGVGIVGKEGRQASLAADFSINQFSYLTKLLVWHGRNSYKRSAKLAQFVIHRGLIISVIQGECPQHSDWKTTRLTQSSLSE